MGTYTPYAPMHSPKKPVSFEQMTAILEKHTGKAPDIKPLPPKGEKPHGPKALKWSRLTGSSILSTRGHVILRSDDIYIVFDSQTSKERTAQVLARFRSAQDAKDFCRLLP